MKIGKRVGKAADLKWAEADNKGKEHCDKCGKRLWIDPGDNLYCDTEYCGNDKYQPANPGIDHTLIKV